jgi:hypothetical protein
MGSQVMLCVVGLALMALELSAFCGSTSIELVASMGDSKVIKNDASVLTLPIAQTHAETVKRFNALLADKSVRTFAEIDRAAEAKQVGQARTRRTIMKVFALGLFAKSLTDEQRKRILPKEVPDTLRLYLDGKIDQFWFREDKPGGVVFLMNSSSVEEARSIVEALPLAANGYLVFEYIPVGPLRPLGLLIGSRQPG